MNGNSTQRQPDSAINAVAGAARAALPAPAIAGWAQSGALRANNIDFLRFVLASLVVLGHSFPLATGSYWGEPIGRILHGFNAGSLAVDCFFIMSGFLIAHSWITKPHLLSYLKRRVLRIYPGFIAAALIGGCIIAPLFMNRPRIGFDRDYIFRLLVNIPRLQAPTPAGVFAGNPYPGALNGSLWTISYEFWCYLGVALCGVAGLLGPRKGVTGNLAFAMVIGAVYALFRLTPVDRYLAPIIGPATIWERFAPLFLAGMVFYLFRQAIPWRWWSGWVAALALVALAGGPWASEITLPIVGTYLLFWIAFHPRIKLHQWAKHGDYSYGLYLYAFPIQQMIAACWGGPTSPWLHFAVAWPASIIAGILSWHLVEKHFMRLKQSPVQTPLAATGPS